MPELEGFQPGDPVYVPDAAVDGTGPVGSVVRVDGDSVVVCVPFEREHPARPGRIVAATEHRTYPAAELYAYVEPVAAESMTSTVSFTTLGAPQGHVSGSAEITRASGIDIGSGGGGNS